MLKLVKCAFAMGNAADSIKAIAGYATDDNNHDGALNVSGPSSITPRPSTPDPSPGHRAPVFHLCRSKILNLH